MSILETFEVVPETIWMFPILTQFDPLLTELAIASKLFVSIALLQTLSVAPTTIAKKNCQSQFFQFIDTPFKS